MIYCFVSRSDTEFFIAPVISPTKIFSLLPRFCHENKGSRLYCEFLFLLLIGCLFQPYSRVSLTLGFSKAWSNQRSLTLGFSKAWTNERGLGYLYKKGASVLQSFSPRSSDAGTSLESLLLLLPSYEMDQLLRVSKKLEFMR